MSCARHNFFNGEVFVDFFLREYTTRQPINWVIYIEETNQIIDLYNADDFEKLDDSDAFWLVKNKSEIFTLNVAVCLPTFIIHEAKIIFKCMEKVAQTTSHRCNSIIIFSLRRALTEKKKVPHNLFRASYGTLWTLILLIFAY